MGISRDRIQWVSAYQNTCALGAATNFITSKLLATPDDQLAKLPLFDWQFDFAQYYNLDPATASLKNTKKLLAQYPNPQDQQIILGPVLRAYLQRLIKQNNDIQQKLYGDKKSGLRSALERFLISNGSQNCLESDNNFYHANQAEFDTRLNEYRIFCANPNVNAKRTIAKSFEAYMASKSPNSNETVETQIKDTWHDGDSDNYARRVGTQGIGLDSTEAAIALNQLGISFTTYFLTSDAAQNVEYSTFQTTRQPAMGSINMVSSDGNWRILADSAVEAKTYNDNFGSTSKLAGCFTAGRAQADAGNAAQAQPKIKNHIATSFAKMTAPKANSSVLASANKRQVSNTQSQWQACIDKSFKLKKADGTDYEEKAQPTYLDEKNQVKNAIKYHYKRGDNVYSFWTTASEQSKLDAELARALAKDESFFDSLLPKQIS